MTQAPPLTDTEPALAPTGHDLARLERLEFGKFCVSPDGPIEKNRDNIPIEYSHLGRSAGFPKELISFCDPKIIGITEGESEPQPADGSHGTVLRPVLAGTENKLRRVFYRVRMRAEEGEGQPGRRYTMARYLVADDDDIDPLMMLGAIDSVPLRGMTRQESAIPALNVSPVELRADEIVGAFLREAVVYVLSGIPLSITEAISEPDFFACGAALWRALPPPLRPHLSLGWNVGSSYSGKLAVTHTASRAGDAALFSTADLTWSPPDSVITWDENYQPVRSSFFDERLEPGRLYAQHISGGDGGWLVNSSPSPEKISTLIGSFPSLKFSELPDWHDSVTIRAFRYPGLKARDQSAITLLEQWLETGEGEDDSLFCLDARALTYQSTRLKALELMIEALGGDVDSRERGDRALWHSLSGKYPDSFTSTIIAAQGKGADRARFMAALARQDTLETLRTLMLAAEGAKAEDLLDEVVASLENCLDDSTRLADKSSLLFHEHLLKSPPTAYRRWLQYYTLNLGALRLISALASMPGVFGEEVYDNIIEINPAPEVIALNEMRKGQEPTSQGVVNQLAAEQRNVFLDLFNREWQQHGEDTADRRERLLVWFHVLKPRDNIHPLLRLEAGEPLSEKDMDFLADEVEQGHVEVEHGYVPQSLIPKVSAFILRQPRLLARVRAMPRPWSLFHALWPSSHARVLVGGTGAGDDRLVQPAIMQAANELKIPFNELQALVNEHSVYATFNGAAPLLWTLAERLTRHEGRRPTSVSLCSYLANGELPDLAPDHMSEIDIFIRLAQESEMAARLVESSQRLWMSASRPWHLLLLLGLFPAVDFKPSATHLGWLVRHRDWLSSHLNEWQIHHQRRENFRLAVSPFHSFSFRGDANLWRDDFTRSVIWAAFSRVPLAMLPAHALREALRAYSGSDSQIYTAEQSTELIEQQANMCHCFLNSYEGSRASEYPALVRVLWEFVFPLLSYRRDEGRVKELFSIVGMNLGLPDYKRKVKVDHYFEPQLSSLLKSIVTLVNGKNMMQFISDYYRE